jgi:hypothetical protein
MRRAAAVLLTVLVVGLQVSVRGAMPIAASEEDIRLEATDDLQAALDAARPGDVIELEAGDTFVGNYVLPNKPGAEWITIRSSEYEDLPSPGRRVSPAHRRLMPRIVSPNTQPAIRVAAGAHHYALIGIEVTTTSPTMNDLIYLDFPMQTLEQVPTDITLDRCYIHGTPTGDIRRGVALNGARLTVSGSYFSDFHHRSEDSQAIMGWNGPGPFRIVGNHLEGAGENVMFGGTDPTIPELVPSDIEIRGNRFVKPLTWRVGDPAYAGIPWVVKNLFELKNARRVLVEGNIFEHNWVQPDQNGLAGQHGFAIVLTPRNQDGTAPWSVVEDVTFRNNIIRRSTAGINILGWDDNQPIEQTRQTKRILIRNNLFLDIGAFPSTLPDSGALFLVSDGPRDVVIDHTTAFQTGYPIAATTQVEGRWPAAGFVFTNNIVHHNQGVSGDGTSGDPLLTLATYFPGATFARNVLVGGAAAQYPSDNCPPGLDCFPASVDDVRFDDPDDGDYELTWRSPYRRAGTDGKDIGVDVDDLERAVFGD